MPCLLKYIYAWMTCFHLFFLQIDIDLSLGARSSVDKGGGYWKEKIETFWLSKNNKKKGWPVKQKNTLKRLQKDGTVWWAWWQWHGLLNRERKRKQRWQLSGLNGRQWTWGGEVRLQGCLEGSIKAELVPFKVKLWQRLDLMQVCEVGD